MNKLHKIIAACVIGTALEWYDFALFGALAATVAKVLFSHVADTHAFILVFAAFASGFVMRPLGALYFGFVGDRYGRKTALSLTITLMALATTLIGLMPTDQAIGLAAPILVVILRLVQGFSASGEYPAAMTWIAELAPEKHKGFYASFSMVGVCLGIISGSLLTSLVTHLLSDEAFTQWGWRALFILSAPLGLLGFILRYRLQESPVFLALQEKAELAAKPIQKTLKMQQRSLIRLFCLFAFSTVTFYIVYVYLTAYLVKHHIISLSSISLLNAGSMLLMAVLIPFFGWLSDRVGQRQAIMRVGIWGALLLTYPLFWSAMHGAMLVYAITLFLFAIAIAIETGPCAAFAAELFPASLRNTGLALALNIPSSFLGGTAPLVCAYLVSITGTVFAPAVYFVLTIPLSLIALKGRNDPCSTVATLAASGEKA